MQQPLDQFSHEEIKTNPLSHCMQTSPRTTMACPSFSEKCCAYSIRTKKMMMTTTTTDRVTRRLPNIVRNFMNTSKPKLMSNLQENTYHITGMEREKKGFEKHKIQGGHFASRNSPNCFLDREDEQG